MCGGSGLVRWAGTAVGSMLAWQVNQATVIQVASGCTGLAVPAPDLVQDIARSARLRPTSFAPCLLRPMRLRARLDGRVMRERTMTKWAPCGAGLHGGASKNTLHDTALCWNTLQDTVRRTLIVVVLPRCPCVETVMHQPLHNSPLSSQPPLQRIDASAATGKARAARALHHVHHLNDLISVLAGRVVARHPEHLHCQAPVVRDLPTACFWPNSFVVRVRCESHVTERPVSCGISDHCRSEPSRSDSWTHQKARNVAQKHTRK